MKKKNRIVSFALIVLAAIAGFTCKNSIGLGGQIDILPPNGEITAPDGVGAIRGSFVLRGKASDDDGVESVSVVFENIKTKETSQTYEANDFSKGSVSVLWSTHIDNEVKGNRCALPDGEYEVTVTVTDTGGKTSTFTKNYKIDNRAPEVEILSPDLSKSQSGDFTMRGSIIDIPSGVKSIKYIVGKQDSSDITVKPAETSREWKELEISGDTWAIPFTDGDNITQKTKAERIGKQVDGLAAGVELYDIPLFFLVEDKAGNAGIISQIIRVDPNGDIPEVKVLSPEADKVLGGRIRIWGTVKVPNPAAGVVNAVLIQITDNTKPENPNEPDFSRSALFGESEWCPADGKPLSYTAGSSYWSVEINGSKEFEAASERQRIIWFRLCGKNEKGRVGQWTEPIKVTVDKEAPAITDMKVASESKIGTAIPSGQIDPENQDYVSNMWIKGDGLYLCAELSHDAGIERIDISGSYLGTSVSLTGDSEITGYQLHNQQCFEADGHNYKMRIPLKTTGNPANNNGFTINVTIKAKKQKEGDIEGLTASTSFSFKYDNSVPTAVFGTKMYSSGIVQVSGASFTDTGLIGRSNINASMKVFTSGEDIAITAFDQSTGKVTLASAPANPTKGYLIYSPIEYLRPDSSGKVWVSGAAYDVGAGVEKVKVSYNGVPASEVTLEFPSGVRTDVGNGDVNFVTWKGELDVSSFVDGTGKIVITPIDRANNASAPIEVPVKLKKEPLKISAVALGTDMNRNGTIADVGSTVVETKTLTLTYNAANPDGIDSEKYDWHGKADGGTFRFKNNTSHIKIGTVGGSGDKKYTLKCVTNGQEVKGLTDLPADGVITLSAADFTKIGQSDDLATSDPKKRKLLLTVWDSAQGLTCGTDTWMAELELDVIVDTTDRIAPTNEINPFKWVSETENSLYGNSRDNGHIEIGTDLPSTFNQTTGLMDKDDKVSGKISITGTAYDDQVITEIWAKIDGFTFTGASTTDAQVGHRLATYSTSTGNFTVESGNVDTNGWKFTVVSNEFSVEKGHTVKWQLDWDSSKITGVVGTDKIITVTVKDTAQTNTAFDSRKVDVVPYITGVSRNSTYNTNRARSGAIPLLRGEAGNAITGFNFEGNAPSLKITENKDGTGSSVAMESLTLSGDKKSFSFTVPDTAKDGYLHLVVNGVAAVNNTNAYTESNMEKSDTYGTAKHSDDRFAHIWRVNKEDTFKGSKNAIYPAMSKGADGTLYASFSNYSKSQVYYSNAFTGGGAVTAGDGATRVFTGYDPPEETDITVDGTEVNVLYAANYHGGRDFDWGNGDPAFPWNDTQSASAGGLYLYDKDAPLVEVSTVPNYFKIYRFELFTYDNELQQFKNIRTVRSGDNIYTVYYDRLTGAVKFAWVDDSKKPDTSSKALPWCVIDGNTDVTDSECKVPDAPTSAPDVQKTFTFVNPDGSTAVAKPYILNTNSFEEGLSVSNAVWESIAVTVTKDGYPVVVYMDAATGSLRLARSTKKQPTLPTDWKIQKVLTSSDPNGNLASDYINACVGSDGVLHIAFQNTRGQLVYVKSTNMSNDGSTKYGFGDSEVLDDSGTSIDMTMDGATPYITYVSRPNSYDAIRIAYKTSMDFNNTGTNVEGWETMTAPLNERAANSRICIETQAKHYNATGMMPVAVGFTTGSDYRAAFYVGK
ncbi:hypothetical protein ABK01_03945 [Treponema sp. OMZ 305]|uniref:hypothetical protein n=1 Tax=Treponema sp. OMZ 305 TaxID=1659192 RepID=UPI0020A37C8D|nr:hypothetical protein [Treponema sp. OMZ 305]UTC57494.1 hypothetical protein ABK01_03945 [Treponema sp. OMZ 305]